MRYDRYVSGPDGVASALVETVESPEGEIVFLFWQQKDGIFASAQDLIDGVPLSPYVLISFQEYEEAKALEEARADEERRIRSEERIAAAKEAVRLEKEAEEAIFMEKILDVVCPPAA
jgi:hypothetical protein